MGFNIRSLISRAFNKTVDATRSVAQERRPAVVSEDGDDGFEVERSFDAGGAFGPGAHVVGGVVLPGRRQRGGVVRDSRPWDSPFVSHWPKPIYGDGDSTFVSPNDQPWDSRPWDSPFVSHWPKPNYGDGDSTFVSPNDHWPEPIYGDGDLGSIYHPHKPGHPVWPGSEPLPPTSPPLRPTPPDPVAPTPDDYAPTPYDRAHGVIAKGYDQLAAAAGAFDEDVPTSDAHAALTGGGFAKGLTDTGEAVLRTGWEAVKGVLDGRGRAIVDSAGWVWDNIGKPVVGWTDDKVFRPTAALLEEFVGEPANSALAKGYAAARGIPEDQALAEIEGAEGAIGGFVKGFAEEGIDIAASLEKMVLEPGETAENFAKLGYMLKTKPHETLDALTTQLSDKYGDWRSDPEAAGRVVAEIASLFVGPEGFAGAEGADAARGAKAVTELTKSVSTSLETREAGLEEALTDAEDALAELDEGTPEYERAAADVEQKRIDLLEERGNQLESYDQSMDLLKVAKDHVEATLEDPDRKLTPAEKAALEASKAEVDEGLESLTNLRKEALEDMGESMREYASLDLSLSHEERFELSHLAANKGVKITPYQLREGGTINFVVEGAGSGGDSVAKNIRDIVGDKKVGEITFDDRSALDGAETVHPTHGEGSFGILGGAPQTRGKRPYYADESRGVPSDIDDEEPVAPSPTKKPKTGESPQDFVKNRIAAAGSGTQDGVRVKPLTGDDLDAAYQVAKTAGLADSKVVLRLPPAEDGKVSVLEVDIPGADVADLALHKHFNDLIADWSANIKEGGNPKKLSEVLGELSTTKAVLKNHPEAEMVFGYDKGGKTGIDQLWKVTGTDGRPTYIFAEAKGGGSKLSTDRAGIDQMSDTWILDRLVKRATGESQSALEARQVIKDLGLEYQGRGFFTKKQGVVTANDERWVTGGKGQGHFVLSGRGDGADARAMIVTENFATSGEDFATVYIDEARPLQPEKTVTQGLHIPDFQLGSTHAMLYDTSPAYKARVDEALEGGKKLQVEIVPDSVDTISFDPTTGKINASELYLATTQSHPEVGGNFARAMYYAANRERFTEALNTAKDADDYARKILDIKRDAVLFSQQVQTDGEKAGLFSYPGPYGASKTAFNPFSPEADPQSYYDANESFAEDYAGQYETVKNGGSLLL